MNTAEIYFGNWMPDQPDFKNPGCVEALNVIPTAGGAYGPFRSFLGSGETISSGCLGAAQFYQDSGTSVIVGGTDDSLFVRGISGITETAGLSSLNGGLWDFEKFKGTVFAVTENNDVQVLTDLDTDTAWVTGPATMPRASVVGRVGDFLVVGNLPGNENRIQWGPFNNPLGDWTPDRQTRAGYADLPQGFGAVRGIVGGRFPVVFQERGISSMRFVGPPTTWALSEIQKDRGCIAQGSIVSRGFLTYFLSQDGFCVTDGSSVQNIGTQKINEYLFANVPAASLSATHGAVDWTNEVIMWACRVAGSDFGLLFIYSWAQDRWSRAEIAVERLVSSRSDGVTLTDLTTLYSELEAVPASLDDERWKGLQETVAAFVDGEYGALRGPTLEAVLVSAENNIQPGRVTHIDKAWPLIESFPNVRMGAMSRDNMGNQKSTPYVGRTVAGFCPMRIQGRKVQVGLRIPPGQEWAEALGAEVSYIAAGVR